MTSLASSIELRNGVHMPTLGLGTYKAVEGDAARAVEHALRHGYRMVDTASFYGNEHEVGAAMAASGVVREDIFVSTKVWNDQQGYESTKAALAESLAKLQTTYVDLYLVHWPIERLIEPTWRAMEELLAEGKTRAIGVCNHLPHQLDRLMEIAEVPPAVDQVEFHPWLQQPSLQAYLAEHDIVLEAWAPLMKGRVGEVVELVAIAEAHQATPAQIAVAWVLQQGYVTIPKSVHQQRIEENADVFGIELTEKELDIIARLDHGQRLGPDPDAFVWQS